MLRALGIGVAVQLLALSGYSWLAIAWPGSPLKYLAAVVLVAGSVWAMWLLHRLPTARALVGIVALATAAPLVPSLLYVKAREMLTPPGDYAPVYLRGFAMAFAGYAVVWFSL